MADQDLNFHIAEPLNDEGLVWKRKKDEGRFLHARDGDMWLAPFQCQFCWFVNLKGTLPNPSRMKDREVLGIMKRVNLDMFWSRATKTVSGNMSLLRREIRLSQEMELLPLEIARGPWPLNDSQGFQLAMVILKGSQEPGRYSDTHQQFDTVRRFRTVHHHMYESSIVAHNGSCCFEGEKDRPYTLSTSPTNSLLHRRFIQGLEERMGREVRQQKGLSTEVLGEILGNYRLDLQSPIVSRDRKRFIIIAGAYFALLFGASLRGNEGLMLESQGLCKYISVGKDMQKAEDSHVLAPLLGRFKSETGERLVLVVIASISKSGLEFRWWLEMLARLLILEGLNKQAGPAFCSRDGAIVSSRELNDEFIEQCAKVQKDTNLIPNEVYVDIAFGTYRSFRIGANTRATEQKVSPKIRNLMNRWSDIERKGAGKPSFKMMDHYLDISQMLETYLTYSRAL